MNELETVKVNPLIRLRYRTRARFWWMRRKMDKRMTPAGREMMRQAEVDYERRFLFGDHGREGERRGE